MPDGSQGNPMTEIALALAMGFFSIMVLTVISMGTAPQPKQSIAAAVLVPSAPNHRSTKVESEDTIVVYHNGTYFDVNLKPIPPEEVNPAGRLILAIDPSLPLGEAMIARSRFSNTELIVSTLNEAWLKALKDGVQ